MESARKIIDAINRGVSPQELAREFPWEEIIGNSAVELLNFAQHSPNNQHSFKVLAYLFRVANENDLWFATEVLSQTIRHPILSSDERKMILTMLAEGKVSADEANLLLEALATSEAKSMPPTPPTPPKLVTPPEAVPYLELRLARAQKPVQPLWIASMRRHRQRFLPQGQRSRTN